MAEAKGKNAEQKQAEVAPQQKSTRLSRAEFIKQTMDRKKRAIDENRNAQVFVSDSVAGAEIFYNLRMIDSMDSAIRKLWGNGIETKEVEKWIKELGEIKTKISNLESFGREILIKIDNTRNIDNFDLRRIIQREIDKNKEEKTA
ncbi:hypothetical protein [Campylobacter helveticus]|uniref:Terminase small subunit n=1 Tax=Campylobacter helveticus TaxID=28898 RepID=A0AAX2UHU3_9BACT|nr:hypothetical protein [Campylobacter helveticus]ARE80612.1 hypothetical protein CHELV3228_1022 [Campylobacter helveticus]MCR2039383.1 hypothetical protein [Campylobacter helveticus]TNB56603.1 hypothetical protein FDW42_07220 [Campylobacter helveticus]TNB57561.1 hypothetical protein FDW44_06920 [Campylobacter helveticus]TNB62872.1 hypothetical protein FDW43_05720 [Campylobacter helveticus]